MILYVKNKFLSLKGKSYVYGENREPIFNVDGKFFSLTAEKTIKDLKGNVLYIVRNSLLSLLRYKVKIFDAQGRHILTVIRRFSIKSKYIIEGAFDDYKIDGTIFGWNFSILRNNVKIGHISRNIDIVDSFKLEIQEEKDAAIFLSILIAIDNIEDRMRSTN